MELNRGLLRWKIILQEAFFLGCGNFSSCYSFWDLEDEGSYLEAWWGHKCQLSGCCLPPSHRKVIIDLCTDTIGVITAGRAKYPVTITKYKA